MTNNTPVIKKETKNKIRIDFERTSAWQRFKIKYLSLNFLGQLVFKISRFILLLGISFVILYPFFSKITSSFMSPEDFVDATVKLVPKYPTLKTYKAVIVENDYFQAMFNTLIVSLMCAVIQTFICCVIGYGFAKYKFKGSKFLFFMVIFTMIVPHQTLSYSMFLKFRYFDIGIFDFGILKLFGMAQGIKMVDTYWPLVILSLTGLAFKNGLYIFMMRQFFRGVPDELEESAYIDGSGVFRTFIQIIIPLSVPMMITIFLFSFAWQWTDSFYTTTSMFFPGSKAPLLLPKIATKIPKSIASLIDASKGGQYAQVNQIYSDAVRNTSALMILFPLILVYLFFQRYLIQGIERSGITG